VHGFLFPWLEENQIAQTFNFVWSIETHEPYAAPDEFRRFSASLSSQSNEGSSDDIRQAGEADRQRLMNLYDDEICYNDHCIGQIVKRLKELDIYDGTLFIVTSDHGDAFYEHGFYAHGHVPYEELIHVPMIFKFPSGQYAGHRVTGLVELIDIFPTVIAVAGLNPSTAGGAFAQGCNLLPLVDGTRDRVRDCVFSDTRSLEIHNRYQSVRSDRWKYIHIERPKRNSRTFASTLQHIVERRMITDILRSPRHFLHTYLAGSNEYLFDLKTDPAEQHNLTAERPELVDHFQQVLENWQQENAELAAQVDSLSYSYEESEILREHLEKLGYM
jgi:arylsulfatase A-like enzyme